MTNQVGFNVELLIHLVVLALNSISIIILLVGVAKASFDFLHHELRRHSREQSARQIKRIKNYLGAYILLSLEILIAADIIETIMNPSLEDILILAAVVIIRTVISYFLGKEIEHTIVEGTE